MTVPHPLEIEPEALVQRTTCFVAPADERRLNLGQRLLHRTIELLTPGPGKRSLPMEQIISWSSSVHT
jgi:hypothetical protein